MVQTAARTDWDTIKEWNDKYVVRSGQARDICACCLWSWRAARSTMPHGGACPRASWAEIRRRA